MHQEAFRHQRMNCTYGTFAVEPANLKAALEGIRALGFLGVNVTLPYKETVLPFLDIVAPTAAQVGAVNTIVNQGGHLVGYNTDGWGFICTLNEAGYKPARQKVVVLGAGGVARAVALHLAWAGVSLLTISNRGLERADALVRHVQALSPDTPVEAVAAGSDAEVAALSGAGLVVNCTPMGMYPNVETTPLPDRLHLLPRSALVYDTVYTPQDTRLCREAREQDLKVIGGLRMLVHQGACAWEYWFGYGGPIEPMYEAARTFLEGKR